MNAIKSFTITGLTMSGFKCFGEEAEFALGNPTVITGGNGRGKSSVADAIAFAVTGLPFFGERGIDRLHAEDQPALFIALRFTDESGGEHELTRSRQRNRMTITYDGREIRQSDLTELFGEKDVFLSIFNPLYFIEELGDEGRKLLERYLPEIPQEQVLSLLSEPSRENLRSERILSSESYLKKKREEIRELEKTVIYLTGQRDLSAARKREAEKETEALCEKLQALEAECGELEARHFAGLDTAELQEKLVSRSERYEKLAKETPPSADTAEVDERMAELRQKRAERGAERYAPKYTEAAAEGRAKVRELAERYKRELAVYKSFSAGTECPTCRRTVTEAELPGVREKLQSSLTEIVSQGKELTGQLNELNALEAKTEETFNQFQTEDLQRLDGEIESLAERRRRLVQSAEEAAEGRRAEMDTLLKEIRSLSAESECGALSPEEYDRLLACRTELEACRSELASRQRLAEAPDEGFDEQITEAEREITERKKRIADVALYVSKRAELLFSRLKMNRVQISLFDVVKTTGEVKDAFRFTYNGRRYDRLSLSEKIRAGMEVSELIKRLTGRNYPQFVDNMESVDELSNVKPTGQVIMAKCLRGTALSVRVPGKVEPMPRAA